MAIVLPGVLAGVASVVWGEVIGALFALNEDTLKQSGTTIGTFADQAAPALAQAEQGADRFTAATGGTTTATGQAFTGHWNTLAANGHTGTFMTIAQHAGPLLGLAAGAIALAKTGAIALLAQCAQQLAAATLTGAAGAMAAIRSITQTRQSIGALVRKLFTRLSDLVTTPLRRANQALKNMINQLNITPGNRLQPAGHPPHLTGNTRTPTTPKGGYQAKTSGSRGGDGPAGEDARVHDKAQRSAEGRDRALLFRGEARRRAEAADKAGMPHLAEAAREEARRYQKWVDAWEAGDPFHL